MRSALAAIVVVVTAGCSHSVDVAPSALRPPRGSVPATAVKISGGNASSRAAVRTLLVGFGHSEIVRVKVETGRGVRECYGTGFAVTALNRAGRRGAGWWETQVLAGAYRRVTGRPICALTLREGTNAPELGVGPGVGHIPRTSPSRAEVLRSVRRAASASNFQVVTVVFHRPARITPEIVVLASDPHHFERRTNVFQREFLPTFRQLDGAYIVVRNPCGAPVWISGGSIITGSGESWADRHWICPFGDAMSQHCPPRRATAAHPCI